MSAEYADRTAANPAQIKKERVHTAMLIELLALMVFMAMAFAFVQKEQDERANPLFAEVQRQRQEIARLRTEIARLERDNLTLKRENETLTEANRRLYAQMHGTLTTKDPPVVLTKSQLDALNAEVARLRQQNTALLAENQRLGGKGVGYPNCLVGGGYYFRTVLNAEGFKVSVVAPAEANPSPSTITGLQELVSPASLSEAEFRRRASAVRRWGLQQPTPCVFSARVKETHTNLALYKRQVAIVAEAFYWGAER